MGLDEHGMAAAGMNDGGTVPPAADHPAYGAAPPPGPTALGSSA
jgi:hypothetical protein